MKTNANTILPIFVVVVVCCCVFLSLSFLSSAILFASGAEMRTKKIISETRCTSGKYYSNLCMA